MTIAAVVFDFAGVFTASPFEAVTAAGAVVGLDPDQSMLAVFGPYDRDTDHPWHQAERGELDLAAVREHILDEARSAGYELDLFEVLGAMAGSVVRDDMVERTRRLKQDGYRTAMITNNIAEFREYWRAMLPLDDLFDVVIDSSEVGMRKPDPRIFELVLDQLGGIEATRAVFLDDYIGNVVAAEALGLHGILVESHYGEAIARLDELLARP